MNYKSELKYQTFFEPLRQKKCHEFSCYFILACNEFFSSFVKLQMFENCTLIFNVKLSNNYHKNLSNSMYKL